MMRRSLVFSAALAFAGCDTGAVVGRPPASPAQAPEDGPPRSSEGRPPSAAPPPDPAPALPDPPPLPPPSSPPESAPGLQRVDTATSPTDAPIPPAQPPPLAWQRVDLVAFSAELPSPIKTFEMGEESAVPGAHCAISAVGPLFLFIGEGEFEGKGTDVVSGMIRHLLSKQPGTVVKREATKWKDVVDDNVTLQHLDGTTTTAVYRFLPSNDGRRGWLIWRIAQDASGRTGRPEVNRFMTSLKIVPNGKPKPVKVPAKR